VAIDPGNQALAIPQLVAFRAKERLCLGLCVLVVVGLNPFGGIDPSRAVEPVQSVINQNA
jgi:hypothetical protein